MNNLISYLNKFLLKICSFSISLDIESKLQKIAFATNIPSIRFACTDTFKIINPYESFYALSGKNDFEDVFLKYETECVLLFSKNIKARIAAHKSSQYDQFPKFISMLSGETFHEINQIEASEFTFSEVVNSFLVNCHPTFSKNFLIHTLTCKVEQGEINNNSEILSLENVLIINNPKESYNKIYFSIKSLHASYELFIPKIQNASRLTIVFNKSPYFNDLAQAQPIPYLEYKDIIFNLRAHNAVKNSTLSLALSQCVDYEQVKRCS